MAKKLKPQPVPPDVLKVWAMQTHRYVGSKMLEEMRSLMVANIEWFPEYARWKQIPADVHTSYRKEYDEVFRSELPEMIEGEGMLAYITRTTVVEQYKVVPFEEIMKRIELNEKREFELTQKKRALWDKYYSAYNIPFQG